MAVKTATERPPAPARPKEKEPEFTQEDFEAALKKVSRKIHDKK